MAAVFAEQWKLKMAVALRSCSRIRVNDPFLSFLVISSSELCEKISSSLHHVARERQCRISVHQCENITEVLRQKPDLNVDIIIFAIDGRVRQSVTEVETNISLIDEQYIITGCVWLVYCNEATTKPSVTHFNAKQLAEKFLLRRFLSADIFDPDNCRLLANRLLNLADGILGLKTGLPMVDYGINFC